MTYAYIHQGYQIPVHSISSGSSAPFLSPPVPYLQEFYPFGFYSSFIVLFILCLTQMRRTIWYLGLCLISIFPRNMQSPTDVSRLSFTAK